MNIKHIWFDMEGTLTILTPGYHKAHDALKYETYAKAVGKPVSEDLKQEYERLYTTRGSNSAVFRFLGLPSDYWMDHLESLGVSHAKPNEEIIQTLQALRALVPISLFTNFKPKRVFETLDAIHVDRAWFTYILSGHDVKERKPALEGFKLMIQKSHLPPEQILYVGDRVAADIRPAKAVGMETSLVYSQSPEADFSFEHFKDISSILDR